jgi:hypothetical protein
MSFKRWHYARFQVAEAPAKGSVSGLRAARHDGLAACQRSGAPGRCLLTARFARQGARPLSLGSTSGRLRASGVVGRLGPDGWFEIPIRLSAGLKFLSAPIRQGVANVHDRVTAYSESKQFFHAATARTKAAHRRAIQDRGLKSCDA